MRKENVITDQYQLFAISLVDQYLGYSVCADTVAIRFLSEEAVLKKGLRIRRGAPFVASESAIAT